jgi:lipoate-protein ligase A
LFNGSGYDFTLWLWHNNPSVIIGYSQDVKHEVDLEYCRIANIEIVRRLSGGGAVYHDMGVVNISLIVNVEKHREFMDVKYTYRVVSKPIVKLLRDLNVDAVFKAPNGVFINDLKIAGFAQYRSQNTLLVHSSVLFSANLDNLYRSLTKIKYPVANVSSLVNELLDMGMFKKEIIYRFSKMFNTEPIKTPLTSREAALAYMLYTLKYSNPLYNINGIRPRATVNICLPKYSIANHAELYKDLSLRISMLYRDINLVFNHRLINNISKPLVFLDGKPIIL